MQQNDIERLVLEELRILVKMGRIFAVDHINNNAGVWAVQVSDAEGFFELSLNAQEHITEAAMEAEIRGQISANRPVNP